MKKPLSFSAYKKYHDCPKMYKFHYIDEDRQGKMTSALSVGTIVDSAVEHILLGKDLCVQSLIDAAKSEDLFFYDYDFDADLVDMDAAEEVARRCGWKGDDFGKAIKGMLAEQENLSKNQTKVLRHVVWESLGVKIFAMIDSFNKWIKPQIKEVHEIQHYLNDGTMHGYLDFTCTLVDGRKVLIDLKTAKSGYDSDAVKRSPQLSLYAAMHDYEYAGFIVLSKTLSKNKVKTCKPCGTEIRGGNTRNCPKCKNKMSVEMSPTSFSQLLVDKVPDWNKELTKEAMRETIEAIDKGVFPRNLNTCYWMYGRECAYIKKCWKLED